MIKTIGKLVIIATSFLLVQENAFADAAAAERGKALYTSKICASCHTLDGTKLVGPSFKGLFGKQGEHTAGTYTADEAYIKESIMEPNKKVVKDYPPAMPPMPLTPEEVNDLVEFIKTVK
jgi:cytochrome c oxidase subunit 2